MKALKQWVRWLGSSLAGSRPKRCPFHVRFGERSFCFSQSPRLEMAKDFPADKYNYSVKPEMRSFGAATVQIASGNVYAAKAGRGENVNWDKLDPKK